MSFDAVIQNAGSAFQKAVDHMKDEFSKLQVGRANPALVDNLNVEVYGSMQPMKAIASVSVSDATTLLIQPWDKSNIVPIEKAILNANLGLNPTNDGVSIRLVMPALTEERRRDLTKAVGKFAEEAKISIRNARQEAHNKFKQMKNDNEMTEDDLRSADKKLQDKVDDVNKQIDESSKAKEQDIMTI